MNHIRAMIRGKRTKRSGYRISMSDTCGKDIRKCITTEMYLWRCTVNSFSMTVCGRISIQKDLGEFCVSKLNGVV